MKLKKEGFDLEKVDELMYVLLPGESDFTSLLKENYENIQKHRYKF